MKMNLLTNAAVVDDAIRFISSNGNKEESRGPDYGEHRLEEVRRGNW